MNPAVNSDGKVHCWQYNGKRTCPGGLVEGIADFVRLRDGLSPPHWKKGGTNWDEGYFVAMSLSDLFTNLWVQIPSHSIFS